jgi:hypothetical protein
MEVAPIAPTSAELQTLRSMARAGFVYDKVKKLCEEAGWTILWDEPDNAWLQCNLFIGGNPDHRRLLSLVLHGGRGDPFALLPLYYFPEDETGEPDRLDRRPFDRAHASLTVELIKEFGETYRTGSFRYEHRKEWPYNYSRWQLDDATTVLLQDEHDIQFGMDVSLWVFAAKTDISLPLLY